MFITAVVLNLTHCLLAARGNWTSGDSQTFQHQHQESQIFHCP